MKIAIDYQEVEVSQDEANYYKELVKQLTSNEIDGKEYFRDLFKVSSEGIITIITPKNAVPWIVIHFIQQLQINQRLRSNDNQINNIIERLLKLEKNKENK